MLKSQTSFILFLRFGKVKFLQKSKIAYIKNNFGTLEATLFCTIYHCSIFHLHLKLEILLAFYSIGESLLTVTVAGGSLVTQPMLQLTPNQMELRLMVSKSFFNVDSKNVSEKFLHRHSWKNVFFLQNLPWGTKGKNLKKRIFSGVAVEELFAYIKKGFRNH